MLSHVFLRKREIIPDFDYECVEVLETTSKLTFGLARVDTHFQFYQ